MPNAWAGHAFHSCICFSKSMSILIFSQGEPLFCSTHIHWAALITSSSMSRGKGGKSQDVGSNPGAGSGSKPFRMSPRAALTKPRKLGDLKQQKFTLWQSWGQKSNSIGGSRVGSFLGSPEVESVSCFSLGFAGSLWRSLVHGHIAPVSAPIHAQHAPCVCLCVSSFLRTSFVLH